MRFGRYTTLIERPIGWAGWIVKVLDGPRIVHRSEWANKPTAEDLRALLRRTAEQQREGEEGGNAA